jgi:hypothetical protein
MPRMLTSTPGSSRWLICIVMLGALSQVLVAQAAGVPPGDTWTRSVHAGGETWIYHFTVPAGPVLVAAAAASTAQLGGGGEAARVPALRRRVDEGSPNGGGAGLQLVDLKAEMAYLNTMPGGQGDDVQTPAVGQTVYFHFDYSIVGASGEVTFKRRAVFDDEPYCSGSSSAAAGAYFAWCADGWVATQGSHTLRWDLDYDNQVAESDENNNSASTMWTSAPAGSVDIVAQRAYLNTMPQAQGDEVTAPTVGQTVYFHVDFRLVGTAAVAVDRRAVIDDQTFCSFTSTPDPGDYFSWCTDGWVATPGSHTLRWDFDYNNTVVETDETNNSVSTMWTSGAGACPGDCDGSGDVTVNELVTMVNVALGNTPVSACTAGDANGDGEITVNEIVAGVNHALSGCG